MNCENGVMGGDDRLPQMVGCAGQLPPIARQPSIYSLTIDKFQSTLGVAGKDFGSMNMEELLKNICSAEENQLMASSDAAALTGFPEACGSGLQRQGSLMTLPRTISLKTVDEVWRDLFRENDCAGGGGQTSPSADFQTQQRQPTLGEITLEEFLVRAGVVREEPVATDRSIVTGATPTNNSTNSNNPNNNMIYGDFTGTMSNGSTGLALGFHSSGGCNGSVAVSQPIQSKPLTGIDVSMVRSSYVPSLKPGSGNGLGNHQGVVQGGGMIGIGDTNLTNGILVGGVSFGTSNVTAAAVHTPANPSPDKFGGNNGDLSSLSPVPYVFERGQFKKGGQLEKAIERRQKRMIKNRESAARSRARKQAYTIELEAEVAKLKEQNKELQKKQEILEVQKKQILEMIIQQPVTKKSFLRRTLTGPW